MLDVGAFGGFYSFEAERRGCTAVTALDYYSWGTDFSKLHAWADEERRRGRVPDNYFAPPSVFDPVGQPGRRAFDVTRRLLGSTVVPVCARLEDYHPAAPCDVVLYLGVLYHCKDPLGAFGHLARVCGGVAVVETLGIVTPRDEDRPLWEFYRDDRINRDGSTWWAPNERGLEDMLLAAGFSRVEILYGADEAMQWKLETPATTRLIVHAFK